MMAKKTKSPTEITSNRHKMDTAVLAVTSSVTPVRNIER